MRFLVLSVALLSVLSALECFVGKIPMGGINHKGGYTVIPKLTKCAKEEGCCVRDWAWTAGYTYSCSSTCPKFNGTAEVVEKKHRDALTIYCLKAVGQCMYNCSEFDGECA